MKPGLPERLLRARHWLVGEHLRLVLLGVTLTVLGAAVAAPDLRIPMIRHYHVISSAALLAIALAILPRRLAILAPLAALGVFFALRKVSHMKMKATGLPLSWTDIANFLHRPGDLFTATGLGGMAHLAGILPWVLLAGIAGLAVAALRGVTRRQARVRAVEAGLALGLGALAVNAAGQDIRDRMEQVVPRMRVETWDSWGQRVIADTVGPIEYLAFSRLAGDEGVSFSTSAPPVPAAEVAAAAAATLGSATGAPSAGQLPNLVYFHAESAFDPNAIFRLDRRTERPLWTAGPDTRALAPLRVNVVGGGTWVTEFEILTGVDSRAFGYLGFYTHQAIGPHVRHGFPAYLARFGYRTDAYYTERASYFNVGQAFANYGFQRFHDAAELGIAANWSDPDTAVIDKVIAAGAFSRIDQPRLVFISTSENHAPHDCTHFRDGDALEARFVGPASFAENCMLNEYLRRAGSTSAALGSVVTALQRLQAETGRPWAIVLYGDHQPYSFTGGSYSIAGGIADARDPHDLGAFRKGDNTRETFFHVIGTARSRLPARFRGAVPATLLPTLMSSFVTDDPAAMYLPTNLLGFVRCGQDMRGGHCSMTGSLDAWGKAEILGD